MILSLQTLPVLERVCKQITLSPHVVYVGTQPADPYASIAGNLIQKYFLPDSDYPFYQTAKKVIQIQLIPVNKGIRGIWI
jgi:hypothetical protein